MVSFTPTSQGTREDQELYLEARLTEVACLDCLTKVRVKKNSEHQTSIQWGVDGPQHCPEFRRMEQSAEGRHVYAPCDRLRNSIERAVADGVVTIGAVDGY